MKALLYCLAYLALSFGIGLALGLFTSPDWNDSRSVDGYFEEALVPTFNDPDDVTLRAICGTQLHVYASRTDTLGSELVDANTVLDPYQPSGKLLYSLPLPLLALVSDDNLFPIVVVAALVAGGFIVGYNVGHEDDPDCGTEAMTAGLQDKARWRDIASEIRPIRAAVMATSVEDYCTSRPRWYRFESDAHVTMQSQFASMTDPPDRAFLDQLCSRPPERSRTVRDVFQAIGTVVMSTSVENYCASRPRWYRIESDGNTELQMQFASVLDPPDLEFLDRLCRRSSEGGRSTREALEMKGP